MPKNLAPMEHSGSGNLKSVAIGNVILRQFDRKRQ